MGIRSLCRVPVALAAAAVVGLSLLASAQAQDGLQPGEAYLTRFSGTATVDGATVIDQDGVVGSIVDLRTPGGAPVGARVDATQRLPVTAGQVGQVFGIAIGAGNPPKVYLSATSAFGLHRSADNSGWMPGMWGANGGGPGTVYFLDQANDFEPAILADVVLDGRQNSGAGLGNIAYDPWHDQLFVSDLETGMIHRLRGKDGFDLGHYDHGTTARPGFSDAASGQDASLPAVAFDPTSAARVADCPDGEFAKTPSCWNFTDFRRRVFGLGVMQDPITKEVRLYYSIWGSQGFGNPDYASAADDQRNSIWSIALTDDGNFDITGIRREFLLPDFFTAPDAIARAGTSNPVTDIAFSTSGDRPAMLLAERGGVRNLGLSADAPFAYPHEARVLRYELGDDGKWAATGRYDVGQYDRKDDGMPFLRANAAGGVAFGPGYDDSGNLDPDAVDGSVWMTGDGLCSPAGPCVEPGGGDHSDAADADGLQGLAAAKFGEVDPEAASKPYPATGPATPPAGPDASYVVDADADVAASDATKIGDVEVFQAPSDEVAIVQGIAQLGSGGEGLPPDYEPPYEPEDEGWDPAPWPDDDDWWDPPPFDLDSDLAIVKTGPATCQKGVDCHYTLKITNLGPTLYIGVLAINDTMPSGATLSTSSPGWHCNVAAPVVSCVTLGFAALGVGVSATLELVIQLPVVIATPTVENCGAIDWFEMGTDDGPGDSNDISCIDTPITDGFDLGVEKNGPVDCVEGADCVFSMKVTNYGPGSFSGTLALHDVLPPGATFVAGPDCVGLAGSIDCQRGGVTLGVGGFHFFIIAIKLPTGIAGTSVENCADIDWSHMGADDGAPDVHADHDCASVNVLPLAGYFDLSINKAGPAHCDAGGECTYDIDVTNNGPDNYFSGMSVHDTMPAGATFVSETSGLPWICVAAAPDVTCSMLGLLLLHPGDVYHLKLTIKLPNPIPGGATTVHNCADLPWGTGGLPADDNNAPPIDLSDSFCVDTNVDEGFDLQVAKTGPAECYEGGLCDYAISVTNGGPRSFSGTIAVKDALPAGATVETSSGISSCVQFAPGTMTCGITASPLAPATTATYHLGVRLPDPVIGDTVENCATLDWTNPFGLGGAAFNADDNAANDGPACVTTPVLAADLAPFGATVCELGGPCKLDVTIDNRGGKLFKGAAGLMGTLLPAVHVSSVTSMTPGLSCMVKGEGAYECNADQLTLKPGESASLQVVIDIPSDFTERRIIHRKEMLWPDSGVKDAVPQDDRHVSTILIRQPEKPICTGGEFVDGECKCPEGQVAKPTGGGNFACVTPPLVCEDGIVRGGQCFCPENTTKQQTGANAFKCVAEETPELTCEGGRVRRGECRCPAGETRVKTGDNAFKCVTPVPEITCRGGDVRDGQCFCPEGDRRVKTGDNAYRCVTPESELTCEGGRIRRGECRCPEGENRVDLGNNHFRCVMPEQPEITCEGGRVRRGECQCPENYNRVTLGDNAYRCVAPEQPEITCEGGRVRRGQCFCPENYNRVTLGDNAYRCVAPEQPAEPELTCEGGRVSHNECNCPRGSNAQKTGPNAYQCVQTPTQEGNGPILIPRRRIVVPQ